MSDREQLGRRRGVWIPQAEVEVHLANGWHIADTVPHRDRVLMAPPAKEQGRAA